MVQEMFSDPIGPNEVEGEGLTHEETERLFQLVDAGQHPDDALAEILSQRGEAPAAGFGSDRESAPA